MKIELFIVLVILALSFGLIYFAWDSDFYSEQKVLCSKMGGTFELHSNYNAALKTHISTPVCYLKSK